MRWIPLTVLFLCGCVFLPRIESRYPNGYPRLVKIVPECSTSTGMSDNYAACITAAEILETTSPKKATAIFISRWEEMAFGDFETMRKQGLTEGSLSNTLVMGSVIHNWSVATKRIVFPVLENIYQTSKDDYSRTMSPQIDLIDLLSRSSFDSFREIHTKAVSTYPSQGSLIDQPSQ